MANKVKKGKPKQKTIAFKIDIVDANELQKLADKDSRKLSQYVRILIQNHILDNKNPKFTKKTNK